MVTINFKGHDYMFYHNGALPNGGGFHRATCIEEFKYNEDGSIPFIPFTRKGVDPVGTLNPYNRVEAETIAQSWGVKVDRLAGSEHYVTSVHNGDWVKVRNVDFGENGAAKFTFAAGNLVNGGRVEVYLDSIGDRAAASVAVNASGAVNTVEMRRKITGIHDVYILVRGVDGELFDLDWWKFDE